MAVRVLLGGCSFAAVALLASASHGMTYYMKGDATDFGVADGYTLDENGDTPATTTPGATDEVIVPSGTFAITIPSGSFTTLSGVARVRPSDGAVLEFTAGENVTGTFEAPVNWDGQAAVYYGAIHHYGKMVKKGAGTLILASSGRTKGTTGLNQDYTTGIDLQEGTLKLPQHATGAMYFGDLTMSNGTKLVTCGNITNMNLATFTYLRSLNGDGIITNETTRGSGQVCSPYARDEKITNVFYGRFCDPVKYWLSGHLVQYGTDTGVSTAVVIDSNTGHLNDGYDRGTYSFENVELLGPSTYVQLYGQGAGIHYFGSVDAVVAKTMYLFTGNYPSFVDAGWHGGLTFTASWLVMGDAVGNAVSKWVVLTGSNTVPCTITGSFTDNNWSGKDWATDSLRTIFTQKLGSGTWRLSGNRSHGGGFAIEEGTLQFDSIAEKGTASALGLSTNLTTACSVRNPEPYRVNYAFALGSTKANVSPAVFEFTGAKSAVSGTRPLVLAGQGGSLRASGTNDARIGFGGISARDAGEKTLVLDGTNEAFNVAADITDGAGKVNVVKDGDGEWTLSGTNTFSGDLHVKAGTLTVLGTKYTWFRFTVRETGAKGRVINIRELALYDANGVRQNICLKMKPPTIGNIHVPDTDWAGLKPGWFAYGFDGHQISIGITASGDPQGPEEMFDDIGNTVSGGTTRFDGTTTKGGTFSMQNYTSSGSGWSLNRSTPATWVPFVMRLTNGAPEIVAYDIESFYDSRGTNNWPKVAAMEASVDGIHWDLVETNALGEVVAEHDYDFSIPLGTSSGHDYANRWYSDGASQTNWTKSKGTTPRPGAGFPMIPRSSCPMSLQNVRSVSVDAGATLRANQDVTLHALKVNASGAGTIDGFAFASSGTVDAVLDGAGSESVELPGTCVNCSGMENLAGWNLKVNGSPSGRYRIRANGDKISLVIKGTVISVK